MYGENVTLRTVTKTYNDYGDATDSNSDQTIKAIVQLLDADDEMIKNGILRVGDAIAFIKYSDYDKIKNESDKEKQIYHQTVWYVIDGLINEPMAGNKIFCEATLKRI